MTSITRLDLFKRTAQLTAAAVVAPAMVGEAISQPTPVPSKFMLAVGGIGDELTESQFHSALTKGIREHYLALLKEDSGYIVDFSKYVT